MKCNFKTKVLLLVSLLIVAGILALTLRLAAVLQNDLEKMVATHLSSSLDYVASDLDNKIRFRLAVLSEIAASVTPEMLSDPAKVQGLLEQRSISPLVFPFGVVVANRQGKVIADYPQARERLQGALDTRDFFVRVMATGRPTIGKPVVGIFSKKALVPMAVPLLDASGAPVGVLSGASPLSDPALFGELEKAKFGKTGFVIVLSPRDKLIVWASDKDRILTPMAPKGVNPLLDRRIDEGYEGVGTVVNSLGIKTLALSKTLKTTGWIVVAGISTAEAYAPIRSLKRHVFVAAILMSLAIVAILYLVLKRQLTPLVDAAAAMRRMSEGAEPLAPIAVRRQDEIGELVSNFNRLVVERKGTEAKIQELNRSLEHRVDERTAELLAANKNLETEMEERRRAESAALDYSTRLQEMTRRYIGVQESEKSKLARELHDRVSSNLTAIGLNLGLIERQLSEEAAATVMGRFADTTALVKDTILSAREISSDLHPAALGYAGVLPALDDYGRKYAARTGIGVKVSGSASGLRLRADREIALFRITQEALLNCAKHAGARTVSIELNSHEGQLALIILDDGVGFDPDVVSKKNSPGLGLLSMRERAEAIGATFRIESLSGRGTRIIVCLPQEDSHLLI